MFPTFCFFRSTHPHRVRPLSFHVQYEPIGFQSTHPHRVRHGKAEHQGIDNVFQSTHPHRVRPALVRGRVCGLCVSIHAPTRGTTAPIDCIYPMTCFNPRTHTGCDLSRTKVFLRLCCFNPRTHTGCDKTAQQWQATDTVSIHAPTRGATAPYSRVGLDYKFQSTHPHGVRHELHALTFYAHAVSIHAPTRGATRTIGANFCRGSCFNPRTHTGCDTHVKHVGLMRCRFQSTHPHGVRRNIALARRVM